ncbi:ABC transporter permease [Streptomyces sp. AJS327]|uniref:ABC transporter permease n=1 Tax=Streptomyces sp. AJS327 TaxID=2545265 RepID=UPI0015DE9BA7|nr:ABC transporter permease [Streptomyces sp. AJS327]MBA0053568.1 ABC transporter permease [Streptomyces sp. AJS327]
MNQRILATGVRRGQTELRQLLRTPREYLSQLSNPVIFVATASMQSSRVADGAVELSSIIVAGGVASMLVLTALIWLPQQLANEREDGTLLRLRGVPHGPAVYVIAKTVMVVAISLGCALLALFGGALVTGSGLPGSLTQWLTLLWVLLLGLVAMTLLGAAIGAILPNPREALAALMLPVVGLLFISGVFFPASVMPRWLQIVGEVFPLKWIAQGVRSAMLPDSAVVAETSGSWQHLETAGVLGVWIVLGLLLAPRLLRRSARRQSGSRLAARREAASQRAY